MAGPINNVPNTFTNGTTTDGPSANANFASIVTDANAAFAPLTLGQSISSLFPLSQANGGIGSTTIRNLLQQSYTPSSTTVACNHSSLTPCFSSALLTPKSSSSIVLARVKVFVTTTVANGTSLTADMAITIATAAGLLPSVNIGGISWLGVSGSPTLALSLVLSSEFQMPAASVYQVNINGSDLNSSGLANFVNGGSVMLQEWG